MEQKLELSKRVSGENSKIRGSYWVTNGMLNKKLKCGESIPDGMWKGRVVKSKPPSHNGSKWYNDGTKNILCDPSEVPDGVSLGRLKK